MKRPPGEGDALLLAAGELDVDSDPHGRRGRRWRTVLSNAGEAVAFCWAASGGEDS